MEFLKQPFQLELVEILNSKYHTFAAEIFSPRPEFEELQGCRDWARDTQDQVQETVTHRTTDRGRVEPFLAFLVDYRGTWLIVQYPCAQLLANVRRSLEGLLSDMPEKLRTPALKTLHAFDELDKHRLQHGIIADTLRQNFADYADSDDESDELPQTLALRQPGVLTTRANLHEQWLLQATQLATIVVVKIGPSPECLRWCHCRLECRRQQLIAARISAAGQTTPMVHCVEVAIEMAKEKSIPALGRHGRNKEFIERCAEAVKIAFPQAETSIDKLSASDQNRVRAALGGEMPYGGCLSTQCLDQKTVIEKDASGIPRCKRCQRAPGFSDEYFMRTRSQRRQDAMDFGLMRERFAYDHDDADPLEERPAKRPRLE